MDDCVFCNIVNKKVPAQVEFEDLDLIVIHDILPKAPVHLLVIPKQHIGSVTDLNERHEQMAGKMILAAKRMAEITGVATTGYKLVFNVGKHGGQIVSHLHLHLLGGKQLSD